jgi:hypothetical protein
MTDIHSHFADLVDIGGRRLYLECHGDGEPVRNSVCGA